MSFISWKSGWMTESGIKKIFTAYIVGYLMFSSASSFANDFACPLINQVKNREISQDFEWTVAEDVTLHSILNVESIDSVSILNHGEFIRCTYLSEGIEVNLDAKNVKPACVFVSDEKSWIHLEKSNAECFLENKQECSASIVCQ